MYVQKRKRKRAFSGHVISLHNAAVRPVFYIILLLAGALLIGNHAQLATPSSQILLKSLQNGIPSLQTDTVSRLRFSVYDILADSVLSIRASEAMCKKYAARYGGVIKKEAKAPEATPAPEVRYDNVLETNAAAKGITFINSPNYDIDAQTLLAAPLSFSSPYNGPRVLIMHTHTSEAYAESADSRSTDPNMNVVAVGDAMAESIRAAGIEVIHDTTQNDNPSYNQSYKKALALIESNLRAHPTIEVVLDVHRDYIKRDDGTMVKPTFAAADGQKAAQIMFVVGTDAMGLQHPDWRHNLSFAVKIQNELNQTQPGMCRSINLRTERFNQHETKGSMIIEVGTGVNTLEEAKRAGRFAGEAIAKVLKENSGN